MPDAFGRGGSSKPSDGLKAGFAHYRYRDMVDLTHRLVTDGLKVAHLRLVIGGSLGCMHQFLWAEWYPDLMDGTVGLSCQPVEISGRNYMIRHAAAEMIRHDPAWQGGNYDKSPTLHMYVAAGNFLRALDRVPILLGAACRRLGQSALGRRRQRALGGRAIVGLRGGCRFGRRVGTRHSFQLAQRELRCKRS